MIKNIGMFLGALVTTVLVITLLSAVTPRTMWGIMASVIIVIALYVRCENRDFTDNWSGVATILGLIIGFITAHLW